MNKIYFKIILSVLFMGKISAQTVNIGEMSIFPETEFSTVEDFDNKPTGDFINDGKFIIYSGYNNDGLVTFSPQETSGLTYFKGLTNAQVISGNELSEFNNVRFENSMIQPAFLLSGAISVFGVADFDRGIISNNNQEGTFLFESEAVPNNANNNSYVDGYVEHNGNNFFEFPVGSGGYFRPASINQNSSNNAFIKNRYIFENSNASYPHVQKDNLITLVNTNEYWEFESNAATLDLALTLGWHSDTTPSELITEETDYAIAIVRWDEAEAKWKQYASAVDTQNETVTAAVDKPGIFTLAKVRIPVVDDIVVYNAVSPNGDGLNDFFNITGLDRFSDNSLHIYNRYGVKVFETINYGVNDNWFKGISEGRVTVNKDKGLPTGTYFYVLKFKTSDGYKEKVGYLYLDND